MSLGHDFFFYQCQYIYIYIYNFFIPLVTLFYLLAQTFFFSERKGRTFFGTGNKFSHIVVIISLHAIDASVLEALQVIFVPSVAKSTKTKKVSHQSSALPYNGAVQSDHPSILCGAREPFIHLHNAGTRPSIHRHRVTAKHQQGPDTFKITNTDFRLGWGGVGVV